MIVRNNCLHFRGDLPCKPHKNNNKLHCENCPQFVKISKQILIIKLGAAGDVIRTTPILHRIRKDFPNAEITWLTLTPVLVPKNYVDSILKWSIENILFLQNRNFDILYNLDKDKHAIGLAKSINAEKKIGYLMDEYGKCKPANSDSESKWLTGLFDDICMNNKKSYPQEILEVCGYDFNMEKYILQLPESDLLFDLPENKQIIGLNTGCGTRWLTRLWGAENWKHLSEILYSNGYIPLLLGGPVEDSLNREIAENSPAIYKGYFELSDFLNLCNHCDLIVTSVTMTMHIAIGLEKKIVLLNNIFNKYEFELYGLGEILEPENKDCLGCYKNSCTENCMPSIPPNLIFKTIENLLK